MPFLLVFFLIWTGCASEQKKERSAKFYYDKAAYYKEKTNYLEALENLRNLRQKFFYSSYNEKALLMTADIYFAQRKFPQSVQSYKKYLGLYPKKQRDYVLYQMGLSYKNQLPGRAEHDLSLAEPALEAFSAILRLKSDSPYKKKAQEEKQKILNKKAERELKTALFFKSQGWNQAGLNRIRSCLKNYPNSPLKPKALFAGFQMAQTLKKDPESFKKRLLKNHPDSKETKALLKGDHSSFFSNWRQKLL